jgi:branched-chain amino acid transport system substrate-binding protein
MTRRLVLLLFVMIALALPARAQAEILLGFANPLSGPYAESGNRNRIGATLAVEELNRNGGVLGQTVSLVTADDACGIETSFDAAEKLLESGVSAVVGHMCSHSSLLAAGVYEAAGVLMITPSSTHPRLTEEGRGNVFRLTGRDDHQGRCAGDLLADHFADRRIAILYDGTAYGQGLAEHTRKRLHERGVSEVVYALYLPGAEDYRPLVERLIEAEAEVVYIGGYGPDAGLILRTAREHGSRLRLISGDALGMSEFWQVAGEAGEGAIFSSRPAVNAPPPVARELVARLRKEGLGDRLRGTAAYAAVQVWAQAAERAGSLETAEVAHMLRRGRFETILGRVGFDPKGDL